MLEVIEDKQYDQKLERRTVVDSPTLEERRYPSAYSFILQVAESAQSITAWGYNPILRDRELRSFWHSESWLASVVYSVSIRNASFAWEVIGSNPEKKQPRNTIRAVSRILNNSNKGKGWYNLILKTCVDLYTQDNGAFWEIIRNGNSKNAPVINISHLDAARCQRTGNPKYPVIYTNRYGAQIPLPYWRVRTIEELPSPIESAYDLQYCAVSRALMAAEIIQSISTYKLEKVSGNFTKSIDAVSGVTQNNIDDAIALAEEQNLNKGLYRFSLPVIIPGVDPTASLSHIHIDLASLPDNFDEDTSFKWYVAQLAAAFGVDYQEIAPLMTGNLGSSQQSEIMHLKTRGKGPALIMGIFEDIINGLMPNNVEFKFLEQDIRSEAEKADAKFTRVKARSMQIKSGELTPKAARELAVLDGDLPRWLKLEVDKAEEQDEMFNQEKPTDEYSPTQLNEGVNTEVKRLTMQDIKAFQKMFSENSYDTLQQWFKSSIGTPSGTVIGPVWSPTEALNKLRNELMSKYALGRARFLNPATYHITLVYSPLVDKMEFKVVADSLGNRINDFPMVAVASKVSSFDTPNGKAVVLLVDKNKALMDLQTSLYDSFKSMNVPLSEYSEPDNWQPHVTLAYIDSSQEFKDIDIDPVLLRVEFPRFTRTDYKADHALDN